MEGKPIQIGPRNDPLGLALRSMVNLEIIERTYQDYHHGHVVTQVIQSLLAFVVFPKERGLFELCKSWRLEDIERDPRWPNLRPFQDDRPGKPTRNLHDVLWHMRNAVSHSRVTFYGEGPDGPDSRDLSKISVTFRDKLPPKDAPVDWQLRLTGPDLRKFCDLIVEVVSAH